MRRKLAVTSISTVNTKKHKHTDGLGLLKNTESEEKTHGFAGGTGEAKHLCCGAAI